MNLNKAIRVFVGMSGGVDSSVAALMLKNQGYDVTGVFIRSYNVDGCAEGDATDARRAAEHLSIPFYVFDFEEEYKREVVDYMVSGYREGLTPNPDIICNKQIKFGLFLNRALEFGADYVATGHYVRLRRTTLYHLHSARDTSKDQSYFLWTLNQDQLKHCLFPLGDYLKPEVREIAKKSGLPNATKKDSQGVCFLGKISMSDFLKEYIPPKKGEVVSTTGEKIGEHEGVYYYTIGQRGIGIGNRKGREILTKEHITKPVYIAEKNLASNTLVVAEGEDNPALYKSELDLRDLSFIGPINDTNRLKVLSRVRYRQPLSEAELVINNQSSVSSYKLIFGRPQRFVAPGQSAVFYTEKGEMLGGGVIK